MAPVENGVRDFGYVVLETNACVLAALADSNACLNRLGYVEEGFKSDRAGQIAANNLMRKWSFLILVPELSEVFAFLDSCSLAIEVSAWAPH